MNETMKKESAPAGNRTRIPHHAMMGSIQLTYGGKIKGGAPVPLKKKSEPLRHAVSGYRNPGNWLPIIAGEIYMMIMNLSMKNGLTKTGNGSIIPVFRFNHRLAGRYPAIFVPILYGAESSFTVRYWTACGWVVNALCAFFCAHK